jgi:hypothetical protein
MSIVLTIVLIAFFGVLAVVTALEKRWSWCLYYVGSVILVSSVLWMATHTEISK